MKHHSPVSVIFDGSTHQGEALAVLVRFANEEFEIVQRLVRLHVLAKSLSANELARDIITILCTVVRRRTPSFTYFFLHICYVLCWPIPLVTWAKTVRCVISTKLTDLILIPAVLDGTQIFTCCMCGKVSGKHQQP